jgi:hypothetical protein
MKQKIRPSRSLWRGRSSKSGGGVPTSDSADLSAKFPETWGYVGQDGGIAGIGRFF